MPQKKLTIHSAHEMSESELKAKGWKYPMYEIHTNEGVFYDMHETKYHPIGNGYDWTKHIGKTIEDGYSLNPQNPNDSSKEPYTL